MEPLNSIRSARRDAQVSDAQYILTTYFGEAATAESVRAAPSKSLDEIVLGMSPAYFAYAWVKANLNTILDCDERTRAQKVIRFLLAIQWLIQNEEGLPGPLLLEIRATLNLGGDYLNDTVKILEDSGSDPLSIQSCAEFCQILLLEMAAKYSWAGACASSFYTDVVRKASLPVHSA